MKLILENIGKIKKAEIDLDHQLTVFFGPNNTGKTYVSYCLYGLGRFNPLEYSDRYVESYITYVNEINKLVKLDFGEFYSKGAIEIDMVKIFQPVRSALLKLYSDGFKKLLPYLFGNYEADFSTTSVFLSFLNNDDEFRHFIKNIPVTTEFIGSPVYLEVCNEGDGKVCVKTPLGLQSKVMGLVSDQDVNMLKLQLLQWVLNVPFEMAFFIPAERIGISVFGKEIIHRGFRKRNVPNGNNEFYYSGVIETAILEQDSLDRKKTVKGKFNSLADEIEDSVLEGKLFVNEIGEIFYDSDDIKNLSIRNTASAIKSLSSLVFYLRYYAEEGQMVIIDEPEINLHPENQRKIAKILAKISNLGIKVYVSTHSDYIIREFNNLIMLGKDDPEKERLMNEYGYKQDEVLDYKKVGAYEFNLAGLPEQIEVKETGLVTESIDEVINAQNRASNDIMWKLFEA